MDTVAYLCYCHCTSFTSPVVHALFEAARQRQCAQVKITEHHHPHAILINLWCLAFPLHGVYSKKKINCLKVKCMFGAIYIAGWPDQGQMLCGHFLRNRQVSFAADVFFKACT